HRSSVHQVTLTEAQYIKKLSQKLSTSSNSHRSSAHQVTLTVAQHINLMLDGEENYKINLTMILNSQ
ncbi:hypothetical protein LOTGIDRAFT_112698, partial [Lottia gigantea]